MRKRSLSRFFRLTFWLSWGLGGAYLIGREAWPGLAPLDSGNPVFLIISCAPTLAAIFEVWRSDGPTGLRAFFAQAVYGVNLGLLIAAFVILPMLVVVISLGAEAFNVPWPISPRAALVSLPLALVTTPLIFSSI